MSSNGESGDTERESGNQESDSEQRYAREESAWSEMIRGSDGNNDSKCAYKGTEKPKRDWLDYATVAALFLAFLAAGAAAVEADRLARDTETAVSDARKSGNDTADNIATLYAAMDEFAAALNKQAENTGQLANAAKASAGYAHVSADAAEAQLREAKAEERAEVEFTGPHATAAANLKISDAGAMLYVQFHIKNIGKTLAEFVSPHGEFYSATDPNVSKHRKKACGSPPSGPLPKNLQGFSIGQGDPFDLPVWFGMSRENVAIWKDRYNRLGELSVVPMLVGCIEYKSEGVTHHTPFVFELDRLDKTPAENGNILPNFKKINPSAGDVSAGEVLFLVPPWYAEKSD